MAYIGNVPSHGEFKKADSIVSSFNGTLTQFDLDYDTVNQTVGDATQLIVSLNGIIQEPGTAYTLGIGGGSIVFASAPASTDTCHIVLLGGVGGTATPSDGSVDASKLVANLKDYLEDEYVANGSQTTYTLTRAVTGTNQILLTIDGIVQPTSAYSISGTTLTISPALPNTTNVRVVHMGIVGSFNAANSITSNMLSSTGGTANQVLAVNSGGSGIEFQTVSGGGGSALTIQEEGSSLSTAATTLNFVGSAVTASGTGATKTITIASGGGADLYAANESSPSAQPSATGTNAIAIGDSAVSSSADGIAIGLGATHTTVHGTSKALAIGANTVADYYGTAIGAGPPSDKTTASGNSSLAIGYTAKSTGTLATAIGKSRASGVYSFAASINNSTTSYGATGTTSIAMGQYAKAGSSGTAIGSAFAVADGSQSVAIGRNVYANHQSSVALGYGAISDVQGKFAYAGYKNASNGDSQFGLCTLRISTTDATATVMKTTAVTSGVTAINQMTLPNNSAHTFSGTIVAREKASEGTDVGAWEVKGIIRREANAGTTVLVNSVINELNVPTGWAVALTADTTLGCLKLEVTGVASTNIRWVATIQTSEVTYA